MKKERNSIILLNINKYTQKTERTSKYQYPVKIIITNVGHFLYNCYVCSFFYYLLYSKLNKHEKCLYKRGKNILYL